MYNLDYGISAVPVGLGGHGARLTDAKYETSKSQTIYFYQTEIERLSRETIISTSIYIQLVSIIRFLVSSHFMKILQKKLKYKFTSTQKS